MEIYQLQRDKFEHIYSLNLGRSYNTESVRTRQKILDTYLCANRLSTSKNTSQPVTHRQEAGKILGMKQSLSSQPVFRRHSTQLISSHHILSVSNAMPCSGSRRRRRQGIPGVHVQRRQLAGRGRGRLRRTGGLAESGAVLGPPDISSPRPRPCHADAPEETIKRSCDRLVVGSQE